MKKAHENQRVNERTGCPEWLELKKDVRYRNQAGEWCWLKKGQMLPYSEEFSPNSYIGILPGGETVELWSSEVQLVEYRFF